jgi:hypothetical protein
MPAVSLPKKRRVFITQHPCINKPFQDARSEGEGVRGGTMVALSVVSAETDN